MKAKFLEKFRCALNNGFFTIPNTQLYNPQYTYTQIKQSGREQHIAFTVYMEQWLKLKEKTTKPSTYKEYERVCNNNLRKAFGNKSLGQLTRSVLQDYLFSFVEQGKHRTAKKLWQILTCIFDLAAEDLQFPSPMKKIVLPYYETKKGNCFSLEEELKLVNYCKSNKDNVSTSAFLVLLYFGLRKSELKTIEVKDDCLTCITSKTRMGRNEVKRTIPFTPAFKRVMNYVDFNKAKNVNQNSIASAFKRLFPTRHLHELRYTFITRAKECGVNPEVVMLWAGHSDGKDVKTSAVNRGYTDYSNEYLFKEAEKINYTL